MKYLLGVDFGGGSSKATLLSEKGKPVCSSASEYPMLCPHVGWAEQDPESIYRAFVRNMHDIFAKSGVSPEDITAMAFDGGTHIAVLLDENDRVIRPAIYWSDTRSARQAESLAPWHEEIMRKSFNVPGPLWTLPQLLWIREAEPENFRRIRRILFLKDYIRFRVTGTYVTDSIEAMGSMLLDSVSNTWDAHLCSLCGIDTGMLPEIVDPLAIVGTPTNEVCRETGLSPRTLVCAGATDTIMEVYASGAIRKGQATLKLATAGRICPVTDQAIIHPLLVTYRHVVPGLWYPGTATKTCAAAMRWYRDVLGEGERRRAGEQGISAYQIIGDEAAKTPAGADGLMFHPYLQGEITPYADPALRASFTGLSSFHAKGHFSRAVMEGVGYSMRGCLDVLRSTGVAITDTIRLIGGGARSPLWRQIIADMLDIPLCRSLTDDSSIGSAMLAGVASGVFSDFEESVAVCSRTGDILYPNSANRRVYDEGYAEYTAIHDALEGIYRKRSQE